MLKLFLVVSVSLIAGPVAAQGQRSGMPSSEEAVRNMLFMAEVGEDDVVYDLGSGDGRVVIAAVRDFGCRRAVGIENNPQRIRESRLNAEQAGVSDRVEFREANLFSTDFSEATVVVLYLGHAANIALRPKLFSTLKPGTRIVSNQFGMGEWAPDKVLTVRSKIIGMYGFGNINQWRSANPHVPDYNAKDELLLNGAKLFMWRVPAPVAGVWRGQFALEQETVDVKLVLHQGLSSVGAKFSLSGAITARFQQPVQVDLSGDHLRFSCHQSMQYPATDTSFYFEGRVEGDVLRGSLGGTTEQGKVSEPEWEMRREKVDLTGTYAWPGRFGTVKIAIQEQNRRLVCTYQDTGGSMRVSDFYDFGGGFYFAALLAKDKDAVPQPFDAGWLIGSAILDEARLIGKISYHLTADSRRNLFEQSPVAQYRDNSQEWRPERVEP